MKQKTFFKTIVYSCILLLAVGATTSCKSKKKIIDENKTELQTDANDKVDDIAKISAEEKQSALSALDKILSDPDSYNDENKKILQDLLAKNYTDKEILEKLNKVKSKFDTLDGIYEELNVIFSDIASSGKSGDFNTANQRISDALRLFASENVSVLPKIGETYERPTTIIKYLNYLKDRKEYKKYIEKLKFDAQGKITTVILNQVNK